MSEKKLFLLDALALIYRAHFAFSKNPRTTSKGVSTGAVYGFANSLLDILNNEKPTHIAVAFDTPRPTFRHEQFKEYKAQRQAQPEDITIAIPLVKRLVEAFNIPVVQMPGYEADDVIGTLALQAEKEGFDVFMMTPDKDYSQLVSNKVFLYKPAFMGREASIWGVPEVLERWDLDTVDQVRDILGLQGDASDNIPGVPGIGEKTAIKLIKEYGSVENLIANIDKLKGKLKERLEENKEMALLCKELVTIHKEVPDINFDAAAYLKEEPNAETLLALFEELEFRSLARRVLQEDIQVGRRDTKKAKAGDPAQTSLFGNNDESEAENGQELTTVHQTIEDNLHEYHLVQSPAERKNLLDKLSAARSLAFDTETDGLDPYTSSLVGLSFCIKKGEAWYLPVPEDRNRAAQLLELFKAVLEDESKEKIGQNIKFDMLMMAQYGIEVKGPIYDTMIAHYLAAPGQRHNMDEMAQTLLGYKSIAITDLIGPKGRNQKSMRDIPVETVATYAAEDADITLQLKEPLDKLIKQEEATKLLHEVEMPLVRVLYRMEQNGVHLDEKALADLSEEYTKELKIIESQIFEMAGSTFNMNSPTQLGEVLFDKMKLSDKPRKTKTGKYATSEKVLEKYAAKHDIVRYILEYRELQKLISTYIDALPTLVSPYDGRVHTSFNQAVTATGRLSSTAPNLQNIPIRTARGRNIRKAFVPESADHVILSADYSQVELRIMADFSDDQTMISAFNNRLDIHTATAAKVFGVSEPDVTQELRRQAKTVNFGIIYGISAFGLGDRLGIKTGEAKEIIAAYFKEFSGVQQYMDEVVEQARETGYVKTLLGRRRYLPDINSRNQTMRSFAERNAINAPIQGTAADMIKVAMVNIDRYLQDQQLQTRMILQVHDELVFEVPKQEIETVKPEIIKLMSEAMTLKVPLLVEAGTGSNWLQAH